MRAYAQSAKDALDAAGIAAVRRWIVLVIPCPYPLFERLKLEIERAGGTLEGSEYAAEVTVRALLPEGAAEEFSRRVTELTAGAVRVRTEGEVFR